MKKLNERHCQYMQIVIEILKFKSPLFKKNYVDIV